MHVLVYKIVSLILLFMLKALYSTLSFFLPTFLQRYYEISLFSPVVAFLPCASAVVIRSLLMKCGMGGGINAGVAVGKDLERVARM